MNYETRRNHVTPIVRCAEALPYDVTTDQVPRVSLQWIARRNRIAAIECLGIAMLLGAVTALAIEAAHLVGWF